MDVRNEFNVRFCLIQMIRKQFFLAETLFNNILQKGSVFLC